MFQVKEDDIMNPHLREENEKPYYQQQKQQPTTANKNDNSAQDPIVVQAHPQGARGTTEKQRSCLKAVCAALLCICCIRVCC